MKRGKLFSPDEETFVYANDAKEACETLTEETGEEYSVDDLEEYPLDTVIHATEMIGIGGFNETYAIHIIQYNENRGIQAPYVIEVRDYIE